MGGAFGALGGNISALDINPAGGAVFSSSELAVTHNFSTNKNNINFYDGRSNTEDTASNFSQIGGVIVIDDSGYNKVNKFSIGIGYTLLNDFDSNWIIRSNISNQTKFTKDENGDEYKTPISQKFENLTTGNHKKFSISFAAKTNKKFHFGGALNLYSIDFTQSIYLTEINKNILTGSTYDFLEEEYLSETGNGIFNKLGAYLQSQQKHSIRFSLTNHLPSTILMK